MMQDNEGSAPGGWIDRPGLRSLCRTILPCAATLALTVCILTVPRHPWNLNEDLSERFVLSYVHEKGLQFGKDIVFTHGPLSFLTSLFYFSHASVARLATDLTVCGCIAAGMVLTAWRLPIWWRGLFLGAFGFLAANTDPRYDLLLYVGLACWGLLCITEASKRRSALFVLILAVLSAFAILVKSSFLVIAGVSVAAISADLAIRRHFGLAAVLPVTTCAGVISGLLAAGQGLTHFPAHILNAFSIIGGYDQCVGLEGLQDLKWRGLTTAVLAVGAVIIRCGLAWDGAVGKPSREKDAILGRGGLGLTTFESGLRRWVLGAWLCSFLFMTWKHGFVRTDWYHVGFFFGFAPILAMALEILPSARNGWSRTAQGLGLACCLVAIVTMDSYFFGGFENSVRQPFVALFRNLQPLLNRGAYLAERHAEEEAARESAALPKLSEFVGTATVDVFGQEQGYALLNGWNYHPRPVFQSYLAFNGRLMRLNEQFYYSEDAPEFVLFRLAPIDRKFPALEDAWLLRDLLWSYTLAAEEGPFLLLKRREPARPLLTLAREGTVRLGEAIKLDDLKGSNLWMEIEVEPSWLGRLRRLVYQPPRIRLRAWRDGKENIKNPAPAPMLAAGFLASPMLLNNADVARLYRGEPLTRPEAYALEPAPGSERFWQERIRYRIYKLEMGK